MRICHCPHQAHLSRFVVATVLGLELIVQLRLFQGGRAWAQQVLGPLWQLRLALKHARPRLNMTWGWDRWVTSLSLLYWFFLQSYTEDGDKYCIIIIMFTFKPSVGTQMICILTWYQSKHCCKGFVKSCPSSYSLYTMTPSRSCTSGCKSFCDTLYAEGLVRSLAQWPELESSSTCGVDWLSWWRMT